MHPFKCMPALYPILDPGYKEIVWDRLLDCQQAGEEIRAKTTSIAHQEASAVFIKIVFTALYEWRIRYVDPWPKNALLRLVAISLPFPEVTPGMSRSRGARCLHVIGPRTTAPRERGEHSMLHGSSHTA
jgi:hypothetical protein